MAQTTVKQLASEVGIPVERLVSRLAEAGVSASSADDQISDDDKLKLLRHLRSAESSRSGGKLGAKRSSVSLRRRSTSELKVNTGRGGSSGRTVSVEVRKRRTYANRGQQSDDEQAPARAPEAEASEITQEQAEAQRVAEQERAEAEAAERARREEEERKEAEERARREEEERQRAEAEAKRQAQIQAQKEAEAQANREAMERERARLGVRVDAARSRAQENLRRAAESHGRTEEDVARERERERAARGQAQPANAAGDAGKGKGKSRKELHVAEGKQGRRKDKKKRGGGRRQKNVNVATEHTFERPTAPVVRDVEIPELITVADLAQRMAVKGGEVLKRMMKLGVMATINQTVDQETAQIIVEEMGHNPKPVSSETAEEALAQEVRAEEDQVEGVARAPVVTIMGHVDHGKTSLLDYIRRTKVQAGEAGGITQHIGAYHVKHDKGAITFIDTPGHAAFTRMRARGAEITDIAILIVAADDGVMPQTKESIQHARAAGVPIVVAVTKMDVSGADIEKVKSGLASEDLIPEDWGGDIQVVPVSSKTGEGVDDLLDAVLLQAEVSEFKAPIDVAARGVVIESSLETGRGPVATILVKAGKLKRGDSILAGPHYGRVRAMFNELGEQVKEAGPSIPVEVLGLSGTPEAGDDAFVVANEKKAREIAAQREEHQRESKLAQQQAARLEEVFSAIGEDGPAESKDLNLLIKGDVQGSVEALVESLRKIPSEEVKIRIVSSGVGGISESDVELALASQAIIIGFNVRADNKARKTIAETGVDVRYYSVIYEAIQDVTDAVSGLLGTELREEIIGLAEVRDVFRSSKLGAIAGCVVVDGAVVRGQPIRVLRNNVVVYEGELESLRRHKDAVDRVPAGTECGIGVKNYNDVKPGDQIEVYERTEVQRKVADTETA
ncbi:translation initiation factor IF-2 [Salinisphaera hydrothermalis]|uniref:Translation initiation factor IF-2 n=1 Tax=Salinisphaera hydrothermalis (strain C41B8) TaxID=1304275 RepID=A0A084IJU9_SALHC|nr:translation initiation factor IF-2 [Salinisphaera hydrothermalis]KEZ76983.1 translation initiation factor IF-2 [Salinisphaera hydrothermalis C41B8]